MAQPAIRRLGLTALARNPMLVTLPVEQQARSTAEVLEQKRQEEVQKFMDTHLPEPPKQASHKIRKSFNFHIGADLKVPTHDNRSHHQQQAAEPAAVSSPARDPFDGLPLLAWAERLGERVMPAYEAVQEEQRRAKAASRGQPAPQAAFVPAVPHVLPFTRWAAQSETFRSTFIADAPKNRPKARLSWYHPDDTMVPRDWFRGGLLADLKYYMPFGGKSSASSDSQQPAAVA